MRACAYMDGKCLRMSDFTALWYSDFHRLLIIYSNAVLVFSSNSWPCLMLFQAFVKSFIARFVETIVVCGIIERRNENEDLYVLWQRCILS